MASDPMLLWLWLRPAATALNRPLAWELPYATGVALKDKKQNKTNKQKKPHNSQSLGCVFCFLLSIRHQLGWETRISLLVTALFSAKL